jgi:mono/diheme cytochrome c family protein
LIFSGSRHCWSINPEKRRSPMGKLTTIILIPFILLAIFPAALQAGDQGEAVDYAGARKIFKSKCSKCHGFDRALKAQKDLAGWLETTARMSSNHKNSFGEEIPASDQEMIAGFLSAAGK